MKKLISIAFVVLLVSFKSFGQTEKDRIKGVWFTNNKQYKIEFNEPNDSYQAKIVWKSKDASDAAKIGDVIISNLKYDPAEKKYVDGILTAKGFKLNCQAQCINTDQVKIIISIGIFTKDIIWTRTN